MNPHNSSLRSVLRMYQFTDLVLFRTSCSSSRLCSSLSLEYELVSSVSPLQGTHQLSLCRQGSLALLDDMNFQIAK